MKIRTMVGLAAVGGLLYMHKRRGGDWTLASFEDSARQLWHGVEAAAEKAKAEAKRQLRDAKSEVERGAQDLKQDLKSTGYSGTDRFPR